MGIDEIQDYVKGLNLGDWDLDGVEITLEDCYVIQTLMEEGMSLEAAANQVLCDIRDCLDVGLDDVGYSEDAIEDVDDVLSGARKVADGLGCGLVDDGSIDLEV